MKPIIDVHAHIFNAMDIPIEGYLRSRSSESPKILNFEYLTSFIPGPQLFTYLADRMRERCIARKLGLGKIGWIYGFLLWLFGLVKMEKLTDWERSLSSDVRTIASELVGTWEDIDLYVPLMIDYEYWFKNTIDNDIKNQIDLVSQIVLDFKGRIHPFAPFDPARELVFRHELNNPDGQKEKHSSLQLVKDAIENKGFIGVKLYNSLGYKPFNNSSVEEQWKRMAVRNEKMQFLFKGEEYDKVLSELYDYCVKNEVPITTHCGMYGIESYPDASFDFGKAIFWRDVLGQEKYKNLHLNLAHFGCNLKEGYYGKNSWVRDICQMLNDYDYLFTDVACHRVICYLSRRKYLSDYKKICRDYPLIKKRLLFGIDWHVIKRVRNFKKFKDKYVRMLKHKNLFTEDEIADFLGRNALKFLGLLPGGKNRVRLEKFYKDNNINQPEWFKVSNQP
jgi:predicted TIM-barrel fold metal-dependent hydrolase